MLPHLLSSPATRSALIRLAALLTCCAALAAPAHAQVAPPRDPARVILGDFRDFEELSLDDLLDVTVSIAAGRVQRLEEAPGIVSVVRDEDIRRMGATTLEQVLETIPGFEILTDNLGRSRIAVRGVVTAGTSENVLVLFNGQRLNEHINGGATVVNLDFPLHNIRQIEIIRGPGSALYGANAFVGVINLVPYTSRSFDGVEVTAGGGTFGAQQLSGVTGHSLGQLGITTAFHYGRAAGPRLPVSVDVQTLLDRRMAALGIAPASLAPTRTAGERQALDFSAGVDYRGLALTARVRDERSDGFIGLLDIFGPGNEVETRQMVLGASQQVALGPRLSLSARATLAQNEIRELLRVLPPNYVRVFPDGTRLHYPDGVIFELPSNTRRAEAGVVATYHLSGSNQLMVGLGLEREATFDLQSLGNVNLFTGASLPGMEPTSVPILPDTSRQILSAFLQDTWNVVPQLGLTAGVRLDEYSDFGRALNPRASLVWRLPRGMHAKALYGRAFRAPTYRELFINVPGAISGNRLLDPSTITTLELALGYKRENFRLSGNYFANLIRDFISPTAPLSLAGVLGTFTYVNTPGIDVHGVELEARRSFGLDHEVFANYTYQRPQDIHTGSRLPDLPAQLASLGGTLGVGGRLSLSPTLLLRGERPRAAEDPRPPLDPYALLNLNVRLRNVLDTFELSGTIGNLLDTSYADPSPLGAVPGDYPRAGRSVLVKASYKF